MPPQQALVDKVTPIMNNMYSSICSPVDELVRRIQEQVADTAAAGAYSSMCSPVDELVRRIQEQVADTVAAGVSAVVLPCKSFEDAARRWKAAFKIVFTELPKRGWYLSGREPINVAGELAERAKANDWGAIDRILLEQAGNMHLRNDVLQQWLVQHAVPDCCIGRFRLVLDHWESGSHDVATIVGITVIDELCRHLYGGRDFTTKRGKQPRPQMACPTTRSAQGPSAFAKGFVETFGLIQEEIDMSRLEDEDYFNRHAILHGQMRRTYGPKDSAKVFMLLMFLVLGLAARGESRLDILS